MPSILKSIRVPSWHIEALSELRETTENESETILRLLSFAYWRKLGKARFDTIWSKHNPIPPDHGTEVDASSDDPF